MTVLSPLLNPAFIDKDLIEALKTAQPDWRPGSRRAFSTLSEIFRPPLPVTITYISDNDGHPDAAKLEIQKRLADINAILSRLTGEGPPTTLYHDIPSQDWRAGAFDLAQASRDCVRGPGNILFVNCAPRLKQRGIEKDNKGEQVYAGMLRNGTIVAAVSEHSFALFRDLVENGDLELHPVQVQTKGSQFRSRDFFPWFTQILAFNACRLGNAWQSGLSPAARRGVLERFSFIDTQHTLTLDDIPDLSQSPCILRTDCHGNLKLSLRERDIPEDWIGHSLPVQVGGESHTLVLRRNMFDTPSGEIGLAPGSSGNWPDSDQGRFLEMAWMGGDLQKQWGISAHNLRGGVNVKIGAPLGAAPDKPKVPFQIDLT